MKKLITLIAILLLVFLVSNISASGLKGRFGITGKGGVVFPLGDFGDEDKLGANSGYGFGQSGEYFINDNISVGVSIFYAINGVDVHDVEGSYADINWKIKNYGAFFKYLFNTESQFLPYVKFDLGFYRPKLSAEENGSESSLSYSSALGIAIGGGISYQVSPYVLLSGELMYHHGFTSGATYYCTDLGSDIQYLNLFIGVTFLVGEAK